MSSILNKHFHCFCVLLGYHDIAMENLILRSYCILDNFFIFYFFLKNLASVHSLYIVVVCEHVRMFQCKPAISTRKLKECTLAIGRSVGWIACLRDAINKNRISGFSSVLVEDIIGLV